MNNIQKSKLGISLVVLMITIVVSLILVSAVIISITNAVETANLTTFAKDLTQMREYIKAYYISNNVLPFSNDTFMIKDEILSISSNSEILTQELTENNDLDAHFYSLDLAKINVTKTPYGTKKTGENDVFVIAYPSMNVYYLHGLSANNTVYFSITSKLTNVINISQNEITTPVQESMEAESIKVSKINGWTNVMGVKVDVNMTSDETLYMSVSGGESREVTTTIGDNIFGFDLLSTIVNNEETIKVPTLTLAEAEIIDLGIKPLTERYVDLIKYKNDKIVDKVRIDLSNFSRVAPTITNAKISSNLLDNTIDLSTYSQDSGVKEVRYEYLTKYTEQGTTQEYYSNITDFDFTYMKDIAKVTKLFKNNLATVSVPKEIKSIKVAVIDRAGNITLYNQETSPRLYIGYTIDDDDKKSLQLTANVNSANGVKTITFSKSIDGVNFTDEQIFTMNTINNGVTSIKNVPYTNITTDSIYIKIVAANYDRTVTETRIIKVDLKNNIPPVLGVNVIATYNTTVNGLAAKYDNPIIPKGFKAINDGTIWPTDWNKGLVIEDVKGNQFAWVPVNNSQVTYTKWCTEGFSYTKTNNDTLPTGITNETSQITSYGGFYVSRYEMGKEGINTVVSKKNATLWNNVIYTDAKLNSELMYNTTEIRSGLVTGTAWDTIMKWVQNSGKDVANSRTWGNYSNSASPANVTGYGNLHVTGFSEYWKANNIYDLSGNVSEWTNEINGANRVNRGGDYNFKGEKYPSSYRDSNSLTYKNVKVGFRCMLYIK